MNILIKTFIPVAVMCIFQGCSADNDGPEPVVCPVSPTITAEAVIDLDVIERIKSEGVTATYSFDDVFAFNSDEMSGWEWEQMNLSDYVGWSHSFPMNLQFRGGRILSNAFEISLATGPSMIEIAWDAYCTATDEKRTLMIAHAFDFDPDTNVFSFNNRKYDVRHFNENCIEFSYETEYWGGRTKNGGKHLTIGRYEKSDRTFDETTAIVFNSKTDCDKYIIKVARERFGSKINLNEVYHPYVILDQPIIDLDALAAQILS